MQLYLKSNLVYLFIFQWMFFLHLCIFNKYHNQNRNLRYKL